MHSRSASTPIRRRREQRVGGAFRVTIDTAPYACSGYAENLSSRGLFITCASVPPIGARLNVRLLLPGHDRPFEVECEVRWHRAALHDLAPGFGLEFIDDAVGRTAVESLVRRFLTADPVHH